MNHQRRLTSLLIALLAFWSPAGAETLKGKPHIIDGDTFAIADRTIRLEGIDAAESGQRCVSAERKFVRPGDWAENRLAELATSGVSCTGNANDEYGRLLATCQTSSGKKINAALVEEGLAWAFTKYSGAYVKQEDAAREAGRGIWAIRCEEPWTFRAKRWADAKQRSPQGCPIKGNISERGRIYHTPWSRHYAKTKIDERRGEKWFCDEREALRAGWRAPIR